MGVFAQFEVDEEALKALPRTEELGALLNFDEATQSIRAIIRMARAVDQQDERELPRGVISQVPQQVAAMRDVITGIQGFRVAGQQDPTSLHDGLVNRLNDIRDWFAVNVRPQIQSNVDAVEKTAEIQAILQRAQEAEEAVERIRGTLQETAGRTGASKLSGNYSGRVTHHRDTAKNFLWVVAALVVVTAGSAIGLFDTLHLNLTLRGNPQWEQFVRDLLFRLVLLGLLSYALAFCVRNYRVNKHLEVVNQQKTNALDTYPLLTEVAVSDTARDLIAAELVRTVFEPGDTGYLGEDQERTVIENQAGLLGAILNRPG